MKMNLLLISAPDWYEAYGSKLLIAALAMSLSALLLVLNRYKNGYRKKRPEQMTDIDPKDPLFGGLTEKMKQEVRDIVRQEQHLATAPVIPRKSLNDGYKEVTVSLPPVPAVERPAYDAEEGPVTLELAVPNQQSSFPAVPVSTCQRCYAKFPADEHRFSADMFVSKQDGEQVYELEIQGDTGTYRVSENEAVQKYALSEDKYLLACAYEDIPTNRNVRISTEKEGHVSRQGNDWHIDQKAVIKFT